MAKPTPNTKTAEQTRQDVEAGKIEQLDEAADPRSTIREQVIAGAADTPFAGWERTYKQRKLSVMPRLKFIGILGGAIDKSLDGGMSLQQLANEVGGIGQGGIDIGTADVFIKVIARLSMNADTLVNDIIMLALGVPNGEQPIVEEILNQPEEDDGTGGLGDDDFFAIAELFVDQNAKAINDFFAQRGVRLVQRAQELLSPKQG